MGKKLVFSLLLVFLSLGAVEIFFRLLPEPPRSQSYRLVYNPELDFPRFYLKDPRLFWRLRPNQVIKSGFVVDGEYRINSAGFRDREFSQNPEARKRRVLCLGNSVTFGWGVAGKEAYPQLLQESVEGYEVYNCGQTGYTTFQGKRLLAQLLHKYRPEVVTIAYVWNDLLPAANRIADSRQKMPPSILLWGQNYLGRLAVYRWGRYLILKLLSDRPRVSSVARVSVSEYEANLLEMLDSCRAYGARPILVLVPAPRPEELGKEEKRYRRFFYDPFQKYVAGMKKAAGARRVSLVDADSALASDLSIWENLPEDFVHPGAGGHRKLASLLEPVIGQSLGQVKK